MSRRAVAIGLILFVLLVALRVAYLRRAEIVVDEFQHLHAAYLVSQGQTPYVDFFEHHTPLFYYVAAPLLRLSGLDFSTVLSARFLSLGAGMATILIASWWARRLRGPAAAAVVAALMLCDFFLFARATVLFLDVFASPFLMLSGMLLGESRGRWWKLFASGLAMGVAILFTQKAVMAGFAPLVFFLAGRPDRERGQIGGRLREIGAFAAGGAVAALALAAILGREALGAFFQDNVVMNLGWKARHFPARDLAFLAVTNGAVYFLALAGVAARLHDLWKRRFRLEPDDVPALFLASLAIGIVLLPVVWVEYFVPVVNFAVLVAGLFLFDFASRLLARRDERGRLTDARARRTAALLIAACACITALDVEARFLLPRHTMSTVAVCAVVGAWAAIALRLAASARARSRVWAAWGLALLLAFPVVEQWDYFRQQSNDRQRARVEFVLANTGPDDPVFDGYSGYGVFRPHAYRYWFLHDEVQLMLSDDERGPQVIEALERSRTPIAIVDRWSAALPTEVQRYISEKYRPTEFPDIRVRKPR